MQLRAMREANASGKSKRVVGLAGINAGVIRRIETEAKVSKPSNPPVQASAKTMEKTMAKKAKATKRKVAPRAGKKSRRPVKSSASATQEGSKTDTVVKMIKRPQGCTSDEVCKETGWAAVSIPPIAARAGIKLRKEKEGRSVRYFEAA